MFETKHTARSGNHPHPLHPDLMNGSNQVTSSTETAPHRPDPTTLRANHFKSNIYTPNGILKYTDCLFKAKKFMYSKTDYSNLLHFTCFSVEIRITLLYFIVLANSLSWSATCLVSRRPPARCFHKLLLLPASLLRPFLHSCLRETSASTRVKCSRT